MLDLSEGIREFVDGAEPSVTLLDIEAVVGRRTAHHANWKRSDLWRKSGVLVAAALGTIVAVLVVGVVVILPSPSRPAKVTIPSNTPVALEVPSTPTLAIRLPNTAIEKGRVKWAKVPDYVPLFLGTSLIGYVTKSSIEHPPLIAAPEIKPFPVPSGQSSGPSCQLVSPTSPQFVRVFGKSHTLVGWISPTSGFVRVGDGQSCGS